MLPPAASDAFDVDVTGNADAALEASRTCSLRGTGAARAGDFLANSICAEPPPLGPDLAYCKPEVGDVSEPIEGAGGNGVQAAPFPVPPGRPPALEVTPPPAPPPDLPPLLKPNLPGPLALELSPRVASQTDGLHGTDEPAAPTEITSQHNGEVTKDSTTSLRSSDHLTLIIESSSVNLASPFSWIVAGLLRYTRAVKRRPCIFLAIYSVGLVLLIGVCWKPLAIEEDLASFVRADGDALRRRDAYLLARKAYKESSSERRLQGNPVFLIRELDIIYHARRGSALDERVLSEIRDFELRLRALPDWLTLCHLAPNSFQRWLCDPGESLIPLAWPSRLISNSTNSYGFDYRFDGKGSDCIDTQALLVAMAWGFDETDDASRDPLRYFPKEDAASILRGKWSMSPTAIRSRFTFLLTYADTQTPGRTLSKEKKKAKRLYEEFVADQLYPFLSRVKDEKTYKHVDVYYSGSTIDLHEIMVTLQSDIMLAIGSIIFVTLYMWFHIKSFLISIGCFFIIFASVPSAYVLTPAAATTIVSFMSLFLVTVIDIDVIFVFMEFWQQSEHLRQIDSRLVWMIVRAGKSCLATSLTTSMGFFANLASVLQPLREFGLFMGLSVMCVYVFALLFLPPLIVVWERRKAVASRPLVMDISLSPAQEPGRERSLTDLSVQRPLGSSSKSSPLASAKERAIKLEAERAKNLELFIAAGSKSRETQRHILLFRLVEVVSFCPCAVALLTVLCLPIFLIGTVAGLEVSTGEPQIFPDDHNQVVFKKLSKQFSDAEKLWDSGMQPVQQGIVCKPDGIRQSNLALDVDGDDVYGVPGDPCVFHWCEMPNDVQIRNSSLGSCWRSPAQRLSRSDAPAQSPGNDAIPDRSRISLSQEQFFNSTNKGRSLRSDQDRDLARCASLQVRGRFAAANEPPLEWRTALAERMASIVKNRVISLGPFNRLSPSSSLVEVAPLIHEQWTTGAVEVSRYFQSDYDQVRLRSQDGNSSYDCEIHAICFLGTLGCPLPGWQQLGDDFELPAPTFPMSSRPTSSPQMEADIGMSRVLEGVLVPETQRMDVVVIWGLRAAKTSPLVGPPGDQWSYDPTFQPEDPWAQRALLAMCRDLPYSLYVISSDCWVDGFSERLEKAGKRFPSRTFDADAAEYYRTMALASQSLIWMVDQRMKACGFKFEVNVKKSIPSRKAIDYQDSWDAYLRDRNAAASVTAASAWHTSSVWPRAEAQTSIISSTGNTILIELTVGWSGILLFTGDPVLACIVLFLVIVNCSGLAFFMIAVQGWSFGPIEVIALVMFVGFSVTYGLHIANYYGVVEENDPRLQEAHFFAAERRRTRTTCTPLVCPCRKVQVSEPDDAGADAEAAVDGACALAAADLVVGPIAISAASPATVAGAAIVTAAAAALPQAGPWPQGATRHGLPPREPVQLTPKELRLARTRMAILNVGGAVLSATLSTIGSSIFLLFCTMDLFVKLGAIVIAVTSLSVFFTLVSLPALLMLVGPPPNPCYKRVPAAMVRTFWHRCLVPGYQRVAAAMEAPPRRASKRRCHRRD